METPKKVKVVKKILKKIVKKEMMLEKCLFTQNLILFFHLLVERKPLLRKLKRRMINMKLVKKKIIINQEQNDLCLVMLIFI